MKTKVNPVVGGQRPYSRFLLLALLLSLLTFISAGTTMASNEPAIVITPDFVYLIEAGDTAELRARFEGNFVGNPVVTWSVDNPAALELTPEGNGLSIKAKMPVATVTITATYEELTATATVLIGYGLESDPHSVLLTELGQSAIISVDVTDESETGEKSLVHWEVSEPSILSILVSDSTMSATVVANVPVGSAMVTATYRDISVEIPVVIATVQPDTRVVSPDIIQSVSVTYQGSTITEITAVLQGAGIPAIQVGDIVINSAATDTVDALLVKVTDIQWQSINQVTITGVPATLAETYLHLDIDLEFAPIMVTPQINGEGSDVASFFSTFCSTSTSMASVELTGAAVSIPSFPVSPIVNIQRGPNGIEYFFVGADIDLGFHVQGPTLDIAAQAAFSFECDIPLLGMANLITFPVPSTPLLIHISPAVGIEGSLGVQFAEASVVMGDLQFAYTARYGVEYDYINGWESVSESGTPVLEFEPIELTGNWDIAFNLDVFPRFKGEVGIGVAPIPPSLLNLRVLSVSKGNLSSVTVPAEAIVFDPLPPDSQYVNPNWSNANITSAQLDPGLDGNLGSIIQHYVDEEISYPVDIDLTLFYWESVNGETADINLAASATSVLPNTEIDLEVTVRPFGTGSLVYWIYHSRPVTIYASKDGAAAVEVGSGIVDGLGNMQTSWTPTETGMYELAALVYDRVTGPFSIPFMTASANVEVTNDPNPTVSEWTSYLYDAANTGFNPNETTLTGNLSLAQVITPPPDYYTSSNTTPLITEEHFYVTFTNIVDDGTLVQAYDNSSGNLVWQSTLPGISFATPVVTGAGMLYLPTFPMEGPDPTLYALSTANGTILWETSLPGGYYNGLVADDNNIYAIGNTPYTISVSAFDKTNGNLVWTYSRNGSVGNLIIVNNTLAFYSGTHIVALNKDTGSFLWEVPYNLSSWYQNLVGSTDDDLIYAYGNASQAIVAFNANTGSTEWSYVYGDGDGFTAPVLANGKLYHVQNGMDSGTTAHLSRFDAATGTVEAVYSIPVVNGGGYTFMTMANDVIYVTPNNPDFPLVQAIDANTGLVIWTSTEEKSSLSAIAIGQGKIYVNSDEGGVYVYE